jgi:muconate cycloisomerase
LGSTTVKRMTVYSIAIPLKRRISHATSQRAVSEPIVVSVELMSGAIGYGETLPRTYVTGESNESVLELLRGEFVKQLLAIRPGSFFEAIEAIDALPFLTELGVACPAARACLELALLDAYLRDAERSIADCIGWMGLRFCPPGGGEQHAIPWCWLGIADPWLAPPDGHTLGMRHFKLKVGFPTTARLTVLKVLGRTLLARRGTLRLDASSAGR